LQIERLSAFIENEGGVIMSDRPFSLFISSRMKELVEERRAVQEAVAAYQMFGWLWERDAGARPESVRETYLRQVENCDLYIGLF